MSPLRAALQLRFPRTYNLTHRGSRLCPPSRAFPQVCTAVLSQQGLPSQVHGAVLSKGLLADLGWRWVHGPGVVLKVQHPDMKGLMDSDVRNLGRLADFVRDTLPFDIFPVRIPLFLLCNGRVYH